MTPMGSNSTALTARLVGSSEVPAVISDATGMVEASLASDSNVLTWKVTYSGLSGPATGAHFHGPATAGQNAGVVVPISGSLASPITGSATLTAGQAADLTAGKWYVNLHTTANPNGEVRGQVSVRP
ncbi:MAG: CHRD domain-containing protein [Pseudomonadota bacterium]|nr:CHRD domain-containing protein [Pseudomonadota bacterium]